jgi:hypothetical protein
MLKVYKYYSAPAYECQRYIRNAVEMGELMAAKKTLIQMITADGVQLTCVLKILITSAIMEAAEVAYEQFLATTAPQKHATLVHPLVAQ